MATVTAGNSANVSLAAGQVLIVSTAGEAAVDTLSGITGAGFSSQRVLASASQFGPYPQDGVLRVRAITGDATHDVQAVSSLSDVAIVSDSAPIDNDGRQDGTVWLFGGQYRIKRGGQYQAPTQLQASEFRRAFKTRGAIIPWDNTSAALQEAHDAAIAEKRPLSLEGETYNITTPVTIRPASVTVYGDGAVLDCTNMSDTHALRLDSVTADPQFGYKQHVIQGLRLIGPGYAVDDTTTGVIISGTNALRSPRPAFHGLSVQGFGLGADLRDYAYLAQFFGAEIFSCATGLRQSVGEDSGENTSWFGGAIYNCRDYCVHTLDESSEINFHGVSFDYSPRMFLHTAGRLALYGCHLENNGSLSGWQDDAIDISGDGADFFMSGGYLLCSGAQPTALNQLINVRHAHARALFDGVFVHNWGNTANKIATGPGIVRFTNTKGYANTANVNPTRISDQAHHSLLADGAFESVSGAFRDGWAILSDNGTAPSNRLTSTNCALSISTAQFQTGTKSLRINKSGAQAVQVVCVMPITRVSRCSGALSFMSPDAGMQAGTTIEVYYAKNNGSDGNGIPVLGNPSIQASFSVTPSASWQTSNLRIATNAPQWADAVVLRIIPPAAGTGSLYLDNVTVCEW